MLSVLTRIFTTRICPTCSKAVHRSKLDAHMGRHAVGSSRYMRQKILTGGSGQPMRWVEILYRRLTNGRWVAVPTKKTWPYLTDTNVPETVARELARLNADLPSFTTRDVPGDEPAVAHEAPVSSYSAPNDPAPNTLL